METEKIIKEVTKLRAEELANGVKDTRFELALPFKKKGMRITSSLRKAGIPIKYSTVLAIAIMRGLDILEKEITHEDKK